MFHRKDYRLRPLTEADLGQVLAWRNSDRVHANMYTDHRISMAEHLAWFLKVKDQQSSVYMVFEWLQKPAGMVYYADIDWSALTCFWGFYLGLEGLPRGTGTVMGILGIEYAFDQLGMRTIYGETFEFNTAGIRFHKRLGFILTDDFSKQVLKNGRLENIIAFSLSYADWVDVRDSLSHSLFERN